MSDRVPAPPWRRAAAAALAAGALLLPAAGTTHAASSPPPPPVPPSAPPAAGGAPPGAADNSFRWAVQPVGQPGVPGGRTYLVHDLVPGQKLDDGVRITNYSDRPMTFNVYGTDAFTTNDGSFSLLPADRGPSGAGTWITPAQTGVTVAPGEGVDVPVTVTVPADAEPGDHAAGIIASVATVQADASGRLVQVDRRIAARAYFRVAGPLRPALQIQDVQLSYDTPGNPFPGSRATVTYRVRNTGNTRVSAASDVKVEGPFGWTLGGPRGETVAEVLPGAEVTRTVHFDGVFPAGQLTASVTVRTGQAPQSAPVAPVATTRTATAWAVPWMPIAVFAAAVLPVAVVLRLRRRGAPAGVGTGGSSDRDHAAGPGAAVASGTSVPSAGSGAPVEAVTSDHGPTSDTTGAGSADRAG
ncbi:WxL protein peptidoglycan domain-containing protein [Yinghuangia sp. YIM S09857]|uniref:WxL protein peptidoglycan domain-containing protein n=1 Tax=Yinghuangia sp. YIM S09857 TaxID=3436929 RepID=UPI003F534450